MSGRPRGALVAEGVRLAKADPLDRWAVGDLAVEAVPVSGETRACRSQDMRDLAEFSRETDLSMSLLEDCRRTSLAWPPRTRFPDISHAQHSRYAARPNRVRLLLREDTDDGLSVRIRERVEKAEDLLGEAAVRQAVIDRAKGRTTRISAAARSIEEEEVARARVEARAREQDERAAAQALQIQNEADMRALAAGRRLARIVTDLLEIRNVIDQTPLPYRERVTDYLGQITRAAQQTLDRLRPATRSPQLHDIVIIAMDDPPETEHR